MASMSVMVSKILPEWVRPKLLTACFAQSCDHIGIACRNTLSQGAESCRKGTILDGDVGLHQHANASEHILGVVGGGVCQVPDDIQAGIVCVDFGERALGLKHDVHLHAEVLPEQLAELFGEPAID